MKFEDMIEFELNIQQDRLKYIRTTLDGKVECDFPPRKIYVEPTNICNYKCVHCIHDGSMTRKPTYIDVDLYKRRLDEIDNLSMHSKIQFTGVGEPLLHPRWDEIIKYTHDKNFFTLMNSNASLLTPENCDRIVASGLDYLHISIDGITKDTYESIRVGGNFELVIENLFNLFEARYKAKGYHLAVVLGIIDQKRNRDELNRFLEYFKQLPFHHVVSGELFNHMGAIDEASEMYVEEQSVPVTSYPVCNTPWDLLSVNSNGEAVGCNYDFNNRFVIGNLNELGFMDLWNSERMQEFRRAILNHSYSDIEKNGPMCSECTIKWQEEYFLPSNFSSEVLRMEEYLCRAISRCATHKERNLEFRKTEEKILARKSEILSELFAGGRK